MAFTGTNQKCTACEKTVYLVDKLTVDNRVYHKSCLRCHHCNGAIKLGNYNSFEGVLYCSNFSSDTAKIAKPDMRVDGGERPGAKVSTMFVGTKDKCVGCKNIVYPTEKVSVNGTPHHRSCIKCIHGGCTIIPSNYRLYCRHHNTQLIREKGNLSQLEGGRSRTSHCMMTFSL